MIRLPAATAAAIVLGLLGCPGAQAWCDEDCAYEAHEAAYERATEREYAREEAGEDGYVIERSRSSRGERRAARNTDYSRPDQRNGAAMKRVAGPRAEPPPSVETSRGPTKVATENSTIATGTTRIAEDDSSGQETPRREVGCKTFFPSAGMTMSVPCD